MTTPDTNQKSSSAKGQVQWGLHGIIHVQEANLNQMLSTLSTSSVSCPATWSLVSALSLVLEFAVEHRRPHNTFVQVLQRSRCWKRKQRLNTNYGWEGFINMYSGDMRGSQSHRKCTVHPLARTPFWLNRSFDWAYNQPLPLLHLCRAYSLCIGGRIPADSSNTCSFT